MSEMAQTAEHLVIIGRGRLLADTSVDRFVREAGLGTVKIVSPEAGRLAGLLTPGPGVEAAAEAPDTLRVTGTDAARIGRIAAAHGIALCELTPRTASLEDAFMELTRDVVEYEGTAVAV